MGRDPVGVAHRGDSAILQGEPRESRRWATLFVWAIWLLATAGAATWVTRYGRRYPYSEDWDIVHVITGQRSFSLGWLWSLRTDHRPLVPRLVIAPLAELSNGDFIVTVWFNFLLLTGMAALAILTMRRVRGFTTVWDAFFPLLLLSLVQPAFNWGYEINHVAVAVVAVSVLLIMTRFGLDVPARWLWVAAALMFLMLGVGAPGLAVLPGLLAWLTISALRLRQKARVNANLILSAVAGVVIGFGLYFVGYSGPQSNNPSLSQIGVFALHLVTGSAGPHADVFWPVAGLFAVMGLLMTAGMLAIRYRQTLRGTPERDQAIALTCFGLAAATVLIAISVGRSTNGWNAEQAIAYSALSVPLLFWVYVVWDRTGSPLRPVVGMILLVISTGAYVLNVDYMPRLRDGQVQVEMAFRRDLCRLEPEVLARRYAYFLLESPSPPELKDVADDIASLERKGMGPFDCP